jgi:hypothetical protein
MADCPKCQGHMEQGFVPDATYGGFTLGNWTEGAPEKSFWKGLKITGRRQFPLSADRCTNCGFIEWFATS